MGLKLLEIERELAGADGAAALGRYDAVLSSLEARLSAALSSGLDPESFARAERLREANTIARKLLRLAVKEGEPSSSRPSGA